MIRVLVANDDGIDSPALGALVKSLSAYAQVYVAAPSQQQSAKSRAMTFSQNLTVGDGYVEGAVEAHAVNGTPGDCVMWAVNHYKDEFQFDFVFSGINMGLNAGAAAFYSGTVAAALEGAIQGVHSIAMSVNGHDACHFDYVCSMIPELMEMSKRLPIDTIISVNGPNIPAWKVKGVKFVDIKPVECGEHFSMVKQEDGSYKLHVVFPEFEKEDLRTDFGIVAAGYVAVSPIRASFTDTASLALMNGMAAEGSLCIFVNSQQKVMDELGEYWLTQAEADGINMKDAAAIARRKGMEFVEKLSRLALCARRLDMPVMLAEEYSKGITFRAVTESLGNYEKINKRGLKLLNNPDFYSLVSAAKERKAILAGGETHLDIRGASRALREMGFDVTVLEDCCISRNIEEHRAAIDNMRHEGCHIETLESFMLTLVEETHHPGRRKIREILRGEE